MSEKSLDCVPVKQDSLSLVKDTEKCVHCGNCLDACMENLDIVRRYIKAGAVGPYPCVGCGQCIAACPEGALGSQSYVGAVRKAIADFNKVVVFSVAPAVRVGLGEAFRLKSGALVEGQIIDALRKLGADYVFDVTFSADLTIIEEGTAFLTRLAGQEDLPVFTSCCPAWVKHMETEYPEKARHLSTAKSPIAMQGATIKSYFAEEKKLNSADIVTVTVAPCTAKKEEIARRELCDASILAGSSLQRDNDYVITTQELAEWMRAEGLDFERLNAAAVYNSFLGRGSGAAVIFGNTGGVMEAVLRMLYRVLTGEPDPLDLLTYEPVRGFSQVKGARLEIGGIPVNVAVVYGLDAADRLIDGGYYRAFDFIEVMTCPGGCISGAGQPRGRIVPVTDGLREARTDALYQADAALPLHNALDNPEIARAYHCFFGQPLSAMARQLLHTNR